MNAKPNIILINCDDLGYGDLGCYGSVLNKTPVLDSIAAHGIRFSNFYIASPLCSPSRGAMMTGCYPPRIGFGDFEGFRVLFPGQGTGLNPYEKTIAAVLKDAGYRTMLIGKWHCGDQKEFLPTRHGFDSYYGLPYSNDMGRQAGRENMPPLPLMLDEEVLQEQPDQSSLTERYTEQAVRFIRNNKKNSFFLYFAHMHVHLPLYAPDRFIKQSRNGPYGAAVECIDWSAGVLLDELCRQGLDKNTLLIFTSDNGSRGDHGGSNAPLRGKKGTTWEGGMRVPCIIYWPGAIREGIVCDDIVSSMDFYPTLAKSAQAEIPGDRRIDGFDISPLIFEGRTSPRTTFFYYLGDSIEAVRHGKWKLHIRKEKNEIRELYDLDEDIGETNNVIAAFPDIAEQLERLIADCANDIGDAASGIKGKNIRPPGKIAGPGALTRYDPNHPYIQAMYDSKDFG